MLFDLDQYHSFKNGTGDPNDMTYVQYRILCGDKLDFIKPHVDIFSCMLTRTMFHIDYAKWIANKSQLRSAVIKKIAYDCAIRHNYYRPQWSDLHYIWFPNTPNKPVCERLSKVDEYKYIVGRICAINGYTELYKSLNILPEVHILEEAILAGHQDIVDVIEACKELWYAPFIHGHDCLPIRRATECDIHNAKYSTVKYMSNPYLDNSDVYIDSLLIQPSDITEIPALNTNIRYYKSKRRIDVKLGVIEKLINNPNIFKEYIISPKYGDALSIKHAALTANIDVYSRVKGDVLIQDECYCLSHGIYKSMEFALWCKNNTDYERITISEKFIMNDNLTYVHDNIYCIWYPELPSEKTCIELSSKYKYLVGRVCAIAGYYNLYKELEILPEIHILEEAKLANSTAIVDLIKDEASRIGLWRCMDDNTREIVEPIRIDNIPITYQSYTSLTIDNVHRGFSDKPMCEDDIVIKKPIGYILRNGNVDYGHLVDKIEFVAKL